MNSNNDLNMPQNTIQDLPTEILDRIIIYVSDGSNEEELRSQASIRTVRLVSRRFKEVARLVIGDKLTIRLATKSLSRFEGICLHHEFRESVTHVTIDLSYYDTQLAEDIDYFGEYMSADLFRAIEMAERTGNRRNGCDSRELLSKRVRELWHVPSTLTKLHRFVHDDSGATVHQKNLIKLHEEYARLTADQERVRLNNQHVWRLAAALKNLPNLDTVHLTDRLYSTYHRTQRHIIRGDKSLDDPEFLISALRPSGWDGFMITAFKTTPPIEMLGELLSRLGNAGLRPRCTALSLGVPVDLRIVSPTQAQAAGIQRLVSKCSEVDISFRGWARSNSLAVDNKRSRSEMLSLGSLITALTRTSNLERLTVSFWEYPVFYQSPNINLSDLLQSNLTLWPKLSHIKLDHVPCDLEELTTLVSSSREIISFTGIALILLGGDWRNALELLKGLKRLERCDLRYPRDGGNGERVGETIRPFSTEKAESYVLGKASDDPFRD